MPWPNICSSLVIHLPSREQQKVSNTGLSGNLSNRTALPNQYPEATALKRHKENVCFIHLFHNFHCIGSEQNPQQNAKGTIKAKDAALILIKLLNYPTKNNNSKSQPNNYRLDASEHMAICAIRRKQVQCGMSQHLSGRDPFPVGY